MNSCDERQPTPPMIGLLDRVLRASLTLAVAALGMQLWWPSAQAWWERPTAGRQGVFQFDKSDQAPGINRKALLYLPRQYASRSDWPLIVYLHGSGERGTDLSYLHRFGLPKSLAGNQDCPAVVASLQCLPGHFWDAEEVTHVIRELLGRYQVDRSRVYLVGYSMGGFGVWEAMASSPELFAGAVAIAGGGRAESAPPRAGCKILVVHSKDDPVVPAESSIKMVEAYQARGWDVEFRLLEDAGHGLGDYVTPGSEPLEWLLSQRLDPTTMPAAG